MRNGVVIGGLKEASLALQLAPKEVQDELRSVLKDAADTVRVYAASIAPRRTGALAGSLKTRVTVRGNSVGAKVFTRSPYAGVRMFGRKASHPGHGHKAPHVRSLNPNPFLPNAMERKRAKVQADVATGIERCLGRLFRG